MVRDLSVLPTYWHQIPYFVGGLGYNPRKHLERNPHVAVVVCAVRVYMWGCACREEQKQPTDE